MAGTHTYNEIKSQPAVWGDALDVFRENAVSLKSFWQREPFDEVIFTGCGSTYYLSLVGARLFQSLVRIPARALPASEIVLYPDSVLLPHRKTLLVTISRSGTTTETVVAARIFRERTGSPVLSVGCYSESELMQAADFGLAIDSAREQSVAQTRSFSSMLVMVQLIAGYLGGHGDADSLAYLPEKCDLLLKQYGDAARQLGENDALQRFFFLGSDTLYGVACEAMLKLKEMSLSYSEAFHTLEFRHGPMSMVNQQTLMIGLISDAAYDHERTVIKQMQDRGARVLMLGNFPERFNDWATTVDVGIDVPVWGRPVLYLPVLQLMAYYRAIANGQDPDNPTHLDAVVSLDDLD